MRTLASIVALAAAATAQPGSFASAPAGLEYTEGTSDSRDLLGTEPRLRYQQIDGTLGPLASIDRLAFRRDGRLLDNGEYKARTVEIEVVMAEADLWTFSTGFAANYVANKTTVFSRKRVQLPDWTQRPGLPPAPLDLVLPLDVTWSYPGRQASCHDLLWEVRIYANSEAGKRYPFDQAFAGPTNASFSQTPPPSAGATTSLGTGCTAAGAFGPFELRITLQNHHTKFDLSALALDGIPFTPATLLLAPRDSNLTIPGLCTSVHAAGGLVLPMGAFSPGRVARTVIDPIPYDKSAIGAELFLQAICPDSSQTGVGLALSNGIRVTVPADPSGPLVGHIWSLDPTAGTASSGRVEGGIVLHARHF